jgi:hypothetical protein
LPGEKRLGLALERQLVRAQSSICAQPGQDQARRPKIILQRHLSDLGVQCLHVHGRLGAIASCLFQQLVFHVMI